MSRKSAVMADAPSSVPAEAIVDAPASSSLSQIQFHSSLLQMVHRIALAREADMSEECRREFSVVFAEAKRREMLIQRYGLE